MIERNILLTSLGNSWDRKSHRYFYINDGGTTRYCDGLCIGEAGAKYILSCVPIDEIIVLGNGTIYEDGEEYKSLVLKDWSDFQSESTDSLSEYSFFQYRLSQFLDGLDMEAVDVMEDIDPERREVIVDAFQKFCQDSNSANNVLRLDKVFHNLSQDFSLYDKMKTYLPAMSDKEMLWLERYIYSQLAESNKLSALDQNHDIRMCFVPTSSKHRGYVPMKDVNQIVDTIEACEGDIINLYIDMQGLDTGDGYTVLAVLSMLGNDQNSPICIKEIISSHYEPGLFANMIDNDEMSRYDINQLVSGMSAFIQYGKVDQVRAYWQESGLHNEHIEKLLYAMRLVDEGVSLCNISDLERGVNLLREVFATTPEEGLNELESNVIGVIQEGIRKDYGALLEGDKLDELELIKWALRKKFYQQSLTIVESRMPEQFVKNGLFYYAVDAETKQNLLEVMGRKYWETAPKDRWGFKHFNHYFVKFYGRSEQPRGRGITDLQKSFTDFRINSLTDDSKIAKAYSRLSDNPEILSDLLYSYYKLGDVRNRVNHAEDSEAIMGENDYDAENENIKLLTEGINRFVYCYEKALKYIEEHKDEEYSIEFLDYDELIAYANSHRNELQKKDSSPKGTNPQNNNQNFNKKNDKNGNYNKNYCNNNKNNYNNNHVTVQNGNGKKVHITIEFED